MSNEHNIECTVQGTVCTVQGTVCAHFNKLQYSYNYYTWEIITICYIKFLTSMLSALLEKIGEN